MGSHSESGKLTSGVRKVALDSGGDLVGIVLAETIDSLERIFVGWKYQEYTKKTTDIMSDAKSVVVIGFEVWDDMLELAIRKREKWVYPEYFPLRVSRQAVTDYLEKNGFKAVSADGLSYKRLAQLAGFGNYGKNALIINPVFGPWIRIATVLTNAELVADEPFMQDLCGNCDECYKACPVGALAPFKVDDKKCIVGIHIIDKEGFERNQLLRKYEPPFTPNTHLMCMICQKACKYGAR